MWRFIGIDDHSRACSAEVKCIPIAVAFILLPGDVFHDPFGIPQACVIAEYKIPEET